MAPSPWTWPAAWVELTAAVVLIAVYAAAARRHPPSSRHVACFAGAITVFLLTLATPLATLAFHYHLWAHRAERRARRMDPAAPRRGGPAGPGRGARTLPGRPPPDAALGRASPLARELPALARPGCLRNGALAPLAPAARAPDVPRSRHPPLVAGAAVPALEPAERRQGGLPLRGVRLREPARPPAGPPPQPALRLLHAGALRGA